MTEYTDEQREKAVRLAALHYEEMNAEWRGWLVAQVLDAGIDGIGASLAVELLGKLATWAERTRAGQALLKAERAQ